MEALAAALADWLAAATPNESNGGRLERRLVLPRLRTQPDLIEPTNFAQFLRDTRAAQIPT